MPVFTYHGALESVSFRGVDFPKGEGVEVADKDLAEKLSKLSDFGAKPAVAAPVSSDGANVLVIENTQLKADLSSAHAAYDELNTRYQALEVELEAHLDKLGGSPIDGEEPEVAEEEVAEATQITIPDDWAATGPGLHSGRIKLARAIDPELAEVITTDAEAIEVITKELKAREAE